MSGGPLPAGFAPLAIPISWGYGLAVRAVSFGRDRGIGVRRLPIPVISVGNLTAGGTGKSPFVAWAARTLAAAGARPAIALRGYAAADPSRSDEALEYRETAPGVPVLAGADRHATVSAALARGERLDCVLLDDGFQHRRLARDLDLVLVDATRPGLGGRLLPAGWLREPAGALRRADLVVVTRAAGFDGKLAAAIRRHHGLEPFAWCDHRWSSIEVVSPAGSRVEPVAWLAGRPVALVAGIGNPAAFVVAARRAGVSIERETIARDHAPWRGPAGDAALASGRGPGLVLTTRKDWVKLAARPLPPGVEVAIPRLELAFLGGEEPLRERLASAARANLRR
jgi:tetraacyldisaccharide 4'-kinase